MSYRITEEQIKDIAQGGGKSKIKQMFPEVFEPKLEVGKWYKHKINGNFLVYFNGEYKSYGVGYLGIWSNRLDVSTNGKLEKASLKEVEEALIAEAKRRFNIGDILTKIFEEHSMGNRIFSDVKFTLEDNKLYFRDGWYDSCIFKDGIWAEVVKPKIISKQEAEDRLKNLTGKYYKIN